MKTGIASAALLAIAAVLAGCADESSASSPLPLPLTDSLVLRGLAVQIPDSGILARRVSFQTTLSGSIKDSVRIEDWVFGAPVCSLRVLVRTKPTSSYAYQSNSAQQSLLGTRTASDSATWRVSGKILHGVGSPGYDGRAVLISNSSEAIGVLLQCPTSSQLVGTMDGILESIRLTTP